MIQEEFPYAPFDFNTLAKKLEDENFHILKLVEKGEFIGFIEIELIDDDIARVNTLIIRKKYRNTGYGKKMLKEALDFLKKEDINIVSILVKHKNEKAKKLYKKLGFNFVGLYQDEESGEIIEEMITELQKSRPSYVS